MPLPLSDSPALQPEQCHEPADDSEQSLMTPARRAALDALEREFHELLNAAVR